MSMMTISSAVISSTSTYSTIRFLKNRNIFYMNYMKKTETNIRAKWTVFIVKFKSEMKKGSSNKVK